MWKIRKSWRVNQANEQAVVLKSLPIMFILKRRQEHHISEKPWYNDTGSVLSQRAICLSQDTICLSQDTVIAYIKSLIALLSRIWSILFWTNNTLGFTVVVRDDHMNRISPKIICLLLDCSRILLAFKPWSRRSLLLLLILKMVKEILIL